MANPLYDYASQGAKAYARSQSKSGYEAQAPQAPQAADEPTEPIDKPDKSMISKLGSGALSAVGALGNVLDVPGSMARDALALENPFDQLLDPFGYNAEKNRVEGRDLGRKAGVIGEEDTWGNFIGGLAIEMVTDPTTYLGFGVLSKAGKAVNSVGIKNTDGILKAVGKKSGHKIGKLGGGKGARKFRVTGSNILDVFTDMEKDAISSLADDADALVRKTADGKTLNLKLKDGGKVQVGPPSNPKDGLAWVTEEAGGYKVEGMANGKRTELKEATALLNNNYKKKPRRSCLTMLETQSQKRFHKRNWMN